MVKVRLEDPVIKEEERTYPYLGVWDDEDSGDCDYRVVLFIEPRAGVILDIGDYSNDKIGEYLTGVVEQEYSLYEGTVILENE